MSWQTDLESDLDWRFAELSTLKIQAAQASKGSILAQSLLRALLAMLYAHYEGFCKTAIRIFFDYLKKSGIRREQCLDSVVVFSLQKRFRESKSFTTKQCWRFYTEALQQLLLEPIDYEYDKYGEIALDGDSNLYAEDLRSNLQNANLPHDKVDDHERLLNSLVGLRNGIAHGQKLQIRNLGQYEIYEQAASEVMYAIAYAVVEAIEGETYRKSTPYEG